MLLFPSPFHAAAATHSLPLPSSFQPAFFTVALLSSIAVASHSSPPAATSAVAPPNRRAPVPQRLLLPATPSAPTHSSAAFASCCYSALVPLSIAAASPIIWYHLPVRGQMIEPQKELYRF
ncbi:hypothetical protein BHE74_00030979 [Ensete ventricosum]|nr:hypothetical protein BHE74_00030979 [Ensete ventricosum]